MEPGPPDTPEAIPCVECGDQAFLLTSWPPDDPPLSGDLVSYRCRGCGDRFDVEVP